MHLAGGSFSGARVNRSVGRALKTCGVGCGGLLHCLAGMYCVFDKGFSGKFVLCAGVSEMRLIAVFLYKLSGGLEGTKFCTCSSGFPFSASERTKFSL